MYRLFLPRGLVPAVILSVCQLWPGTAAADPPPPAPKLELRFLNWSEYMDPELLKEFPEIKNWDSDPLFLLSPNGIIEKKKNKIVIYGLPNLKKITFKI